MEKFKKRIESVFEKLESELENIISDEALIEPVVPKTEETFADITLETNVVDVKTVSRNLSFKSDENQNRDEDLDSLKKCELNTVLSDGENLCEDSLSNRSKSDHALCELDGSVFFSHQSDGSTCSETSESSFVVLERESSTVHKEIEFDGLMEESNLSQDEFDIANNNMAAQDSFRKNQYTFAPKKSYNNENPVQEQDKIFSLCLEELKKFKQSFENFLEELENRALKQNKLNLGESKMSPKPGKSNIKSIAMRKGINTSNFTSPRSKTLENNFITKVDKSTSPEGCLTQNTKSIDMQSLKPDLFACDCCNGRYLHPKSNSITVEWDLDACKIKENGNCSLNVCKPTATESSTFKSYDLSSRKFDVDEKSKIEEYCSGKRNTKPRLTTSKPSANQQFKKWVLSSAKSNVIEKQKNEENYSKNNKKYKLISANTDAANRLVKRNVAPSKMSDVSENKRRGMQHYKRNKNSAIAEMHDKNNEMHDKNKEIGKKRIYFTDKPITRKDVCIVNIWEHAFAVIFILIVLYFFIFK